MRISRLAVILYLLCASPALAQEYEPYVPNEPVMIEPMTPAIEETPAFEPIEIPDLNFDPKKQKHKKKEKVKKADLKRLKKAEQRFLDVIEQFNARAPKDLPRDKAEFIVDTTEQYEKFRKTFEKRRNKCDKLDRKNNKIACQDNLITPSGMRDVIANEKDYDAFNKKYPFASFEPGQNVPILGKWAGLDEDFITITTAGKVADIDPLDRHFVLMDKKIEDAYNAYSDVYADIHWRADSKLKKKLEKRSNEVKPLKTKFHQDYYSLRRLMDGGFDQFWLHPAAKIKEMRNNKYALKVDLEHHFKGRVNECDIEYQDAYFDGYVLVAHGQYDSDQCMMNNVVEEDRPALVGTDFWFVCKFDDGLEHMMDHNMKRGKPYVGMTCAFYQPVIYVYRSVNLDDGSVIKQYQEVTPYIKSPTFNIHLMKLDDGNTLTELQTFTSLGAPEDALP